MKWDLVEFFEFVVRYVLDDAQVITLIGDNLLKLQLNEPLNDPGATPDAVTDNKLTQNSRQFKQIFLSMHTHLWMYYPSMDL